MSKRFVAKSPLQNYVWKLRFGLGVSILSVCLLSALVAYLALGKVPSGLKTAEAVEAPKEEQAVKILLSGMRIESGARLKPEMFEIKTVPRKLAPSAAIGAERISQLTGKFAVDMIPAHSFMLESFVAEKKPGMPFDIPTGYRAVTVKVDAESGVEGFAKPGSRVDVIWSYGEADKVEKVVTIVPFARVLSVSGRTSVPLDESVPVAANGATATLLVSARDAKKIEFARRRGALSLSLVGDKENYADNAVDEDISLRDLLGGEDIDENAIIPERPEVTGLCSYFDKKSGSRKNFLLSKNRWRAE